AATLARFLSFEFERVFAGGHPRALSLVRIRTTLRRQLPSLAFCRSNSNDTSQTAAVARFLPFEFERHFADSYRRSFSAVRIRTTLRRQLPSFAFCRSNSNDTSRAATVARFLPFEFERHFAGSYRRSLSAVRIRTTLRGQLPSLAFCRSNSNDTSRAAAVVCVRISTTFCDAHGSPRSKTNSGARVE